MPAALDQPDYWHGRANEARQLAEQIADYGSKSVLLRIAVDYERIAARASMRTAGAMVGKTD
jgi:hypothetical protein